MIRYLYSCILIIISPILLIRLYFRAFTMPAYRLRVKERFGNYNFRDGYDRAKTTIWIHAVSVGEVAAAEPLVRKLRERYPEHQFFITTMTPTGSERVRSSFPQEIFHCYLPYDFPLIMYRFVNQMSPAVLIIMETELWPNLINACDKLNVKVVLANARLSEKSAKGYSRISEITRGMLSKLAVVAAQSKTDAQRLINLGANPESTVVVGNLKFNVSQELPAGPKSALFTQIKESGRTVIIAASTRKGEEEKLLKTIKSLVSAAPTVLFIIVPRHPERFDEVFGLFERDGFKCLRRSTATKLGADTEIVIGDSMGELNSYYRVSQIAFVGGSLVDTGCQNVLEPAALSLPILTGPSQYNFSSICENLEKKGGLITVKDEMSLKAELTRLIKDKSLRSNMGAIALAEVNANQGALSELLKIIEGLLD